MAESSVRMKLLIDSRERRVLFAEAGKECVDFLFYLLSLPVATIIRLLGEEGMEGSLPNLYKSLENLNDSYIQPNKKKDTYLKPVAPMSSSSVPLLALDLQDASTAGNISGSYSCSYCGRLSSRQSSNVRNAPEGGGLVKEVVTYMVMDNLEVKPMSTISSITLLNHFNVRNVRSLEEKLVNLGMNEAIKLLKISLRSNNVLTELFC